jgi:hypothetical protein
MTRKHWTRALIAQGACTEAVEWAKAYPTFKAAWHACPRGDWLLWWLGRAVPDTPEHRERITCVAIRIVLAIPGREAIAGWEEWAQGYLEGKDRTRERAAEAAEAARAAAWAARAAWEAAEAAGAAWAAGAAGAARAAEAAQIVRGEYPEPVEGEEVGA